MATKTDIANLALGHLKISLKLTDVDTDNTSTSRAILGFYDLARDEVLRDFAWPFARKTKELSGQTLDPTTEWAYSYAYPTDCVKALRIVSGIRPETNTSKIPFEIRYSSSKKRIYTDLEEACLEYTVQLTDTERYDSDFVLMFSYLLAHYVAPQITGGDSFKLGDSALKLYAAWKNKAQENAVNENQYSLQPESEFIRGR